MSFITLIILFLATFLLAFLIERLFTKRSKKGKVEKQLVLSRAMHNPIISPNEEREWESQGTFNPGVVQDDFGNAHLLYRAVGSDGVSRIGYSSSTDNVHFDERLPYPVFAMQNPRENFPSELKRHSFILYPSGGSWGGSEDPRIVRIDGRVYVSFNTFDGWDFIRVSVISIDENDFFAKRWNWTRPLFLSPTNEVNKNWVMFPEKIHGKFAILHSVSPEVLVDFVDRLEDLAFGRQTIKSHFGQKKPRESWDSWSRGAGPPPIKTEKGWLVLYHAIDKNEPGRYKLGALLLDLADPRKILARGSEPLLVPDAWYENDWKPGIVYVCGALVKDGTLFVYYGGGDKYVCVASAPLQKVLGTLERV